MVDYTREDCSRAGRVYDIVFDTVGKSGFSRSLKSLKRGGSYVRVGGSGRLSSILGGILEGMWASITGAAKVIGGVAGGAARDLSFLKGLIEAAKIGAGRDTRDFLDGIAEPHPHCEPRHKQRNLFICLQ